MKETADQGFFKDLESMMNFPPKGIYSTVIKKSAGHNYTLMCLAKGTDIETHTSTKNGCVLVLKGKGRFRLFENDIEMKPGISIFMPPNAPHALVAEEDLAILLILTD